MKSPGLLNHKGIKYKRTLFFILAYPVNFIYMIVIIKNIYLF